jgi:hypothetical protein
MAFKSARARIRECLIQHPFGEGFLIHAEFLPGQTPAVILPIASLEAATFLR